jgi:AraC-like DNA-binding protein
LKERDNLTPRGAILDPEAARRAFVITRHVPSAALAPFVRHYWFVRWSIPPGATYTQYLLPVPSANAVIQRETDVVGLSSAHRAERVLEGDDAAFGTLFRATGLSAIAKRAPGTIPVGARWRDVFRGDAAPIRALAFGGGSDEEIVAALERYWLAEEPVRDPRADEVEAWVALAENERSLGRAELLADRVGVGLRTLERRMRELVGFSPKQLLRRHRLQEAAARLEAGGEIDQAELALSLGYADQAHFVRDFAAVVGRPPAKYARAQKRSSG